MGRGPLPAPAQVDSSNLSKTKLVKLGSATKVAEDATMVILGNKHTEYKRVQASVRDYTET